MTRDGRWLASIAVALGLLVAPLAAAQDVEEEVEEGGVYVPEEIAAELRAPPDDATPTELPDALEDTDREEADAPLVVELPDRVAGPPTEAPPIHFVLENGLSVWLQPVQGRRQTALAVTYRVGSGDVPDGWTGLAHLTEHLMFSGTDVLDEVEVYLRLEAAGATERNGETSPDRSVYYEVVPTSQLDHALFLESHRMARLLAGLTEARVARQRDVVLHEGWERGTYGWRGLLASALYGGVFPAGHPYARAIVERAEDVEAIRLRHVQWFFQRHYGPSDATLSVVGGFDPDRVRAAIERRFGPIRRSAPAVEERVPDAVRPLDHERRITISIQEDRDQLFVAWPTPALYAPGDAELDVISTLLAERRDAPLRRALVESGLALEASVRQRSHRLGSVFSVQAVPAPGHTVAELVAATDRALDEVRARGFTAEEVERARDRWVRDERLRIEDLATRALRFGLATPDFVPTAAHERERYGAVDAEDVRRTLDAWLPARRRLVLTASADPEGAPRGEVLVDERVAAP